MQKQKESPGDMDLRQKDRLEPHHQSVVQEMRMSGDIQSQAVPPVFTQKVSPVVVKAGQDAVFRCQFAGKPAPSVTWLRENQPVPQSAKYQVSCAES